MRGDEERQEDFIMLVSLEDRILSDHPFRTTSPRASGIQSALSLVRGPASLRSRLASHHLHQESGPSAHKRGG
jgi:hypothetical protein